MTLRRIAILFCLAAAVSCSPRAPEPEPSAPAPGPVAAPETHAQPASGGIRFTPVGFAGLAGWESGDPTDALTAFRRSCDTISRRDPSAPMAPRAPEWGAVSDWLPVCAAAPAPSAGAAAARAFFEQNFTALSASAAAGDVRDTGLLTGYYEPELQVSPTRTETHSAPIHGRPSDLVRVDLGAFDSGLSGQQIMGKVRDGALVPYDERAQITVDRAPVLAWGPPVDVFFLQVQGSGRLAFADGTRARAAFAAHNGRPYRSIGSVLIQRGELTSDTASKDNIEAWVAANPGQAQALFNENPRYVFFGLEPVTDAQIGPRGAQGVPLTARASMAVDPTMIAYGAPVWLNASLPQQPGDWRGAETALLVIAQDTGGAITGPMRGDLFFGSGDLAGRLAGVTRAQARWTVLAPHAVAARLAGEAG